MNKIILPLTVTLPRKTKEDKVFALNLNIYRNAHHMVLAQAKIKFKEDLVNSGQLFNLPLGNLPGQPFVFTYNICPPPNRKFDLANVLQIVQKFTDDSLIEYGIIPDDSYKIIPQINYRFGGVDKDNPRVELVIETLKQGDR